MVLERNNRLPAYVVLCSNDFCKEDAFPEVADATPAQQTHGVLAMRKKLNYA